MGEISISLGKLRRKRGLSAIQLANTTGVKRQTIYAMEAGTYVPNTAVALRLARALDTTVEELFALADEREPRIRTESVALLPDSETPVIGQTVQLCRVDKKLVAALPSPAPWYLPATDAVVADAPVRSGRAGVRIFRPEGDFTNRILVAGCDPGISVLSRHVQRAGIELIPVHRNSSQSLALLKEGCVHIAGTHLRDESRGDYNREEIARVFPKNSVAVISFAVWEQGILTPRGNPKGISGIEDLARRDICLVNREQGAGSRSLLDFHLRRLGIPGISVIGYSNYAPGHLAAALKVQSGEVDCCVATRAAARALGLNFLSLARESYDFVVRKGHLTLPRIQNLFEIMGHLEFRREMEELGGYDTSVAGQRAV